jgi:molybdate transport system permease protein
MVAGNMPGRTQTLPLAIYDAVQLEQFSAANTMVLLVTAIAFFLVGWVRYLESQRNY